jgi:hypothetical protein
MFSLVVDDFGVKYEGLANAHHLINALEQHYTVSKDWIGGVYCDITLHWHYLLQHVDLSMPGYITSLLHKYQHPPSKRPQYTLHIWTEPAYGQRIQYAPLPDDSAAASAADITRAQGIVGTLIYYARYVDPTLSMPLGTIASRLSISSATTMDAVSNLLEYCSTKPHANIRYYASDMQLKIHSDVSYISEPNAKSRIGGYFFLSNSKHSQGMSLSNEPLLCQSTVLKQGVSSVAEAEYGALFVNAKTGPVTRETLKEMGHPPRCYRAQNQQHHRSWNCKQNFSPKKIQSYKYALLLDPRLHQARTIRRQLAPQ